MLEYRARWAGGRVGSGYSVFHTDGDLSDDLQGVADEIRGWFSARAVALPNDITLTFEPEIKELSLAGALQGIGGITAPTPVAGQYSGDFSAAAGRIVRWTTGLVNQGKRLIGHTYLVPSGGVTGPDGNILSGTVTADATAHAALVTGLNSNGTPLVVWSRRFAATGAVTQGQTLVRPVSLRSRND